MKKTKIIIFLFAAAALAASAAAWYFLPAENVTEKRSDLSSDLRSDLANPENSATYENPEFGFSFRYPKDFVVSEFSDGGGEVILLSQGDAAIQIYISPYEDEEEIAAEKIRRDIPDLVMENLRAISVGGKGQGVEFRSSPTATEVWFSAGGNLFQISALVSAEAVLREIVESWKFQ